MNLDADVYIYKVETVWSSEYYQLYEAYQISGQGAPTIRIVGNWSRDSDSLYFVKEDKYSRRGNLEVSMYIK